MESTQVPSYNAQKSNFIFSDDLGIVKSYCWVHLSCVNYNPLLSLVQKSVKGFNEIDKENFGKECIVCQTNHGLVSECYHKDCKVKFHIECARRANLTLVNNYSKYQIYCADHTPMIRKNLFLTSEKILEEALSKYIRALKKYLYYNNVISL